MTDSVTVFVSGTIYWAKIVGDPVPNYEKTAKEWVYDFVPDDTTFLKENRLLDRLKEDKKGNIKGDYLHLRKPELTSKGEQNEPIRIYDADDKPWVAGTKIGNGSKVDVKLRIMHWGKGKKSSIYTTAIRVTDHIPYDAGGEFSGMAKAETAEASKVKTKTKAAPSFDDSDEFDDIPF